MIIYVYDDKECAKPLKTMVLFDFALTFVKKGESMGILVAKKAVFMSLDNRPALQFWQEL